MKKFNLFAIFLLSHFTYGNEPISKAQSYKLPEIAYEDYPVESYYKETDLKELKNQKVREYDENKRDFASDQEDVKYWKYKEESSDEKDGLNRTR